jgi:hypothetical protein
VPTEWSSFAPSEAEALHSQYVEQSKQIYQQYSGASENPYGSVGVAGFHILNDAGAFLIITFTVPPQSDLINLLKNQIGEKMDFGVRQGYIRRYLGLTSVDDAELSGFYTKAIGSTGDIEVSGGLEDKKLKNTVIQLTLLAPNGWDDAKATKCLSAILKSVVLKDK